MSARRRAHTLFETILVMAVLLLVGFLSLPLIQPMFADGRLQAAEDMVKARLADARMHASAEGRAYRFGYQENTGNFRIAPDGPEFWGENGKAGGDLDHAWVFEGELPKDVLFCQAGAQNVPQEASSSQDWTRAMTFFADGSARENAQIAFGKSGSRARVLRLEGVIGAVTSEAPPSEGSRP